MKNRNKILLVCLVLIFIVMGKTILDKNMESKNSKKHTVGVSEAKIFSNKLITYEGKENESKDIRKSGMETKLLDTSKRGSLEEKFKESIGESNLELSKKANAAEEKQTVSEILGKTTTNKGKETKVETILEIKKESSKEIAHTIKDTAKETIKEKIKETIKEPVKSPKKEKVWVVDIKARDAVIENKCKVIKAAWTETTDQLLDFDQIIRERWFVTTELGTEYFYSSQEALDRHNELGNKGYLGNWGTAEDEEEIVNKVYKTIEHPAETKCEKVLLKEAVKEQGHWEYR